MRHSDYAMYCDEAGQPLPPMPCECEGCLPREGELDYTPAEERAMLEELSLKELRSLCREMELGDKGGKRQLIESLQAAMAAFREEQLADERDEDEDEDEDEDGEGAEVMRQIDTCEQQPLTLTLTLTLTQP